jgi:hypothetical protein
VASFPRNLAIPQLLRPNIWAIVPRVMKESETKAPNQRAAARRSCEPPRSDGSMRFHRMHQFWELAEALPVKKVRLSEREF